MRHWVKKLFSGLRGEPEGVQEFTRVDLVDMGRLKIFMYVDDLAYRSVPPSLRNYQMTREDRLQVQRRKGGDDAGGPPDACEPIGTVLKHYWLHGLDFVYVDVGCQYGTSALAVADFIRASGRPNRVVAFEPGVARDLVAFNIEMNGFEDLVTFEEMAVSDLCGPTLMFCERAHSENNRIVNRAWDRETRSYVVRATSLDAYLERKGIASHAVLKIDTQGAEYRVVQGMAETIRGRLATFVMEFTPWALAPMVDPEAFCRELMEAFVAVDLMTLDYKHASLRRRRIRPDEIPAFVREVAARPGKWTDLLLVPKKLPGAEDLLAKVLGHNTP